MIDPKWDPVLARPPSCLVSCQAGDKGEKYAHVGSTSIQATSQPDRQQRQRAVRVRGAGRWGLK